MKLIILLWMLVMVWKTQAEQLVKYEVEVKETEPPPPGIYAFGYAAGRFPGNIDRIHSEVSDGSGTVRGSYSYVDPRYRIRKVEYTADKYGFHPILNETPAPLPRDSPVVAAAKERHLKQYAAIASARQAAPGEVIVPVDTATVERAKLRHLSLYEKIAEEHRRIAAEKEAQKLAEEAAKGENAVEQR